MVEAVTTPEQKPPAPYRGRLLGLDPVTLQIEATYPLDDAPGRLAIAPDGDAAYVLSGGTVIRDTGHARPPGQHPPHAGVSIFTVSTMETASREAACPSAPQT